MQLHFIYDLVPFIAENFPGQIVLSGIQGGKRINWNSDDYMRLSAGVACFLRSRGLKRGECVLNISENCPEWNFTDLGIMLAGGIHVPVSPSLSNGEIIYIINQTNAGIIFISGKFILRRLQSISGETNGMKEIVSFNKIQGTPFFGEIISDALHSSFTEMANRQRINSKPDDTATIIYTSGSTGMPKGVMLSHKNIMSGLIDTQKYFNLSPGSKVMSYLPLSHSFERWMNYVYQYSGIAINYADYSTSIINNLAEIQPDAVATVPLFLEKIADQINSSLNMNELSKPVGDNSNVNNEHHELIHSLLGNQLKMLFTAGAALGKKFFDYFTSIGIPVYEIYGSSETLVIAFNFKGNVKQGTVGRIKEGCLIKLSEENEILLKGDHVMKGYLQLPEKTKEAVDNGKWYHSGDIGQIDDEEFITISGRKTDIFKTSSGAFVSPVIIENLMTKSPCIRFALVFGENQSRLGIIVVPDYDQIRAWLKKTTLTNEEIVNHPEVINRIEKHVETYNHDAVETEVIGHIILLPEEWSVEGGELTSSQKLKRRYLLDKYKELILKQYN